MACQYGISDMHLEPHDTEYLIRFRLEGRLVAIDTLTWQAATRWVSQLKTLAHCDTTQTKQPFLGGI